MPSTSSCSDPLSPADAMHLDVLREHPDFLPQAETVLRKLFLATSEISPVSRAVRISDTVALPELFPVLKGARMMGESTATPHDQIIMMRTLETMHHGTVILTILGCGMTPETLAINDELQLHIQQKKKSTASKNKLRKQAAAPMVAIVSLSSGLGCAQCGRFGGSEAELVAQLEEEEDGAADNRKPHFLRCTRCWEKLRLPIWYCCRECQDAHYLTQHRRLCGKMLLPTRA